MGVEIQNGGRVLNKCFDFRYSAMAVRACVNIIKKSSFQRGFQLSQSSIHPKVSSCYSPFDHHPSVLSMMGLRFATKAKQKGVVKNKSIPGYRVAVTKGFDSQHTGSLKGSYGASDRLLDDIMIRKYVGGVFYHHLDSDIIIKRKDNRIIIAFVVKRELDINNFYFLSAMSEKLLSEVFSCIVKFEPQSAL